MAINWFCSNADPVSLGVQTIAGASAGKDIAFPNSKLLIPNHQHLLNPQTRIERLRLGQNFRKNGQIHFHGDEELSIL